MQTMKAVTVKQPGGAEQLMLSEVPLVKLEDDSFLVVKIKATALNRADISQREGRYPPPPGASSILGLEMSGIIIELGSIAASKGWKIGDRICALLSGGGYAEYCTIHYGMAIKLPDNMSFEEGACLPEAFMTAWQTSKWIGGLKEGSSILIHAGASGVGTSIIQIAKHFENTQIYVTCGSQDKIDFCKSIGATEGFNRKQGPWIDGLMHSTQGKGVDIIIDCVGASYFQQNLQALAMDGVMVIIAYLGGAQIAQGDNVDISHFLKKRITVCGSTLRARPLDYKIRLCKEVDDFVMSKVRENTIKPIIAKVFPWEDVADAHRFVEKDQNIGKVILVGM